MWSPGGFIQCLVKLITKAFLSSRLFGSLSTVQEFHNVSKNSANNCNNCKCNKKRHGAAYQGANKSCSFIIHGRFSLQFYGKSKRTVKQPLRFSFMWHLAHRAILMDTSEFHNHEFCNNNTAQLHCKEVQSFN